jgi:molybdopterin biosynthesis enzyme
MRVARDGGLSKNESGRAWLAPATAGRRASKAWVDDEQQPVHQGRAGGSAADTVRAGETTPVWLDEAAYDVVDTGDLMPDGRDAVVMREHVHYDDAGRAELRAAAPYQHVRSIGEDVAPARVVASAGTLAVHGVAVRPGHPVVLGVVGQTPVLGAPGYPVSAALAFDIFAVPLLAELSGASPRRRPVTSARLARKLASPLGLDDWVRVRLGPCCAIAGSRRRSRPSAATRRARWAVARDG